MACSCALAILIIGALTGILGAILGWAVFPPVINKQLIKNTVLENGSDAYARWEVLPQPMILKIYVFNVSNPEDVSKNGAKPIVNEIGPFVYSEARHKYEIQQNDTDELTYLEQQYFTFLANQSFAPDDTVVVMLNPAMTSLVQVAQDITPATLRTINKNLQNVFPGQDSIFLKISVKDIMFDGYTICPDYPNLGFVAKQICDTMYSTSPTNFVKNDNGSFSFTLFGYRNRTNDYHITIGSGVKDYHNLGNFQSINGQPYNNIWAKTNSSCDKIYGTDSLIYPPLIQKGDAVASYSTDICRAMDLHYVGDKSFANVPGWLYKLTPETLKAPVGPDDPNACFCIKKTTGLDGKKSCLLDGALDLYNCQGAPIVLTFPHFYLADETYLKTVDGLKPDANLHETFEIIEPNTGTPLSGTQRAQLNMFIRPIPHITLTAKLPPALMPMFWIDEGADLDNDLVNMLNSEYFNVVRILTIVKWTLVGVGALALIVGIIFMVCQCRKKKEIV